MRLSQAAEADLLEIGQYTLDQWGASQADRYLYKLEACFQRLAKNPGMGRDCRKVAAGLRRFEHGEHVVFYRIVSDGIAVSRILYRGMLTGRSFPELSDDSSD